MRPSEKGSALPEFVIVASILFAFVFAGMDFALIIASDNAGSNAAREGARQAILNFDCADLHSGCANPNPALQAITARATSRLGGLTAGTPTVTVVCWDGTAVATAKNCDANVIVPGVDLVEVDVAWKRLATSAYASVSSHTDKATMTIQGSGQGTHTTACQVVNSTVNPPQAQILAGSSGPLVGPVVVTAQTNGLCQPLYLAFSTGSTPDQSTPVAMTLAGADTYSFTIAASAYNWTVGSYNLNLSEVGVYPLNPAPAPVLTVSGASLCSITAASVTPSAVVLAGASPGPLAQGLTLTVTTSSSCAGVNTVVNTDATIDRVIAMTGPAPTWTLSISPTAYNWTVGSKQLSFTDPSSTPAAPLQTPASVIVQVALRCAVSVALSPSSITATGGVASSGVAITATPTVGADCNGLTVVYTYATGLTATATMSPGGGVYQYTIPQTTLWTKGRWSMSFSSNNTPMVSTSPSPVQVVVQ